MSHSDTSSPSSPLNSAVDALLTARVKLDATNDYGRTALHLAAVCARGDYVKKLLSALVLISCLHGTRNTCAQLTLM